MVTVEYTYADGRKFNPKVDPEATFETILNAWDPFAKSFISETEVRAILKKYVDALGMGFHPDTAGEEYQDYENGKPSFTFEQAKQYDREMAYCFGLLGDRVYDIGMEIMSEDSEVGNA